MHSSVWQKCICILFPLLNLRRLSDRQTAISYQASLSQQPVSTLTPYQKLKFCIIENLRSEGKEKQSQGSPGAFPPSLGHPRGLCAFSIRKGGRECLGPKILCTQNGPTGFSQREIVFPTMVTLVWRGGVPPSDGVRPF